MSQLSPNRSGKGWILVYCYPLAIALIFMGRYGGVIITLTRQSNFSLLSLCRTYFTTASAYGNENRIIRADVGKAWTQKAICREDVSINTVTCANFPLIFAVPCWFTTSRPLLIIGMILLWHWLMDQIYCVHPMHYAHEYPRLKDQ